MEKKINIYVGYDPVESVAWHTFVHSIYNNSTKPVSITPINLENLKGIYNRKRDPKQSNEFSFSRFLVPYLNDYKGFAIFCDCDMLMRADVSELLQIGLENPDKAIHVVKHTYKPRDDIKYLNTVQYAYPRKNWSSVVVWNCSHPSNLAVTLDFVNTASAMELHRFLWLKDDEIGALDVRWNWLVGEYDDPPQDVKYIHWTNGGPYFKEYQNVDFSDEWRSMNEKMSFCKQLKIIKQMR